MNRIRQCPETHRTCGADSAVRVHHHRLGVVIRKGIIETGFDDPLGRQQALVYEKRDDPCPEQLLQRLEARIGQDIEQARAGKQPVGNQCVQVGMK